MTIPQPSLWEELYFKQQDFILIGGGFAGLWCAIELKKKHPTATVLILEKGSIPTGASTRNAGFACFGSPTELISNAARAGENAVWPVVQMRFKGIEKIRRLFSHLVIDYDVSGGYECLHTKQAEVVADNLGWLNKGMQNCTGKENCFSWCNHQLGALGLTGFDTLIHNPLEGGLHSGKLLLALQAMAWQIGVQILSGIEVTGTLRQGSLTNITTSANIIFKASRVVFCTNAFTSGLLPQLEQTVYPGRGQVLVTEPIKGLHLYGTFHYNEGYYYFRNVGNRVLLGGGRNADFDTETTTEFGTTDTIQQQLEIFLQNHILKGVPYTISHRWSGIMGFTNNHLPTIQKVGDHSVAVIGCNGMGVALLPILAEQVAALW